MGKFIVLSFVILGLVFYEASGGAEFEPELRAPVAVAQTDLAPVETAPVVTRADTSSLNQIAGPTAAEAENALRVETVSFTAPLPAGEVLITPAPAAPAAEEAAAPTVVETPAPSLDLRAVAGDWVNMRTGPSTDYLVMDTLPRGTQAEVVEINAEGWAKIRVTNTGQEGWMAERLLSAL